MKPKNEVKVESKPGRPSKPIPKIDATAEGIAERIFANAKLPDPSIRVRNKPEK